MSETNVIPVMKAFVVAVYREFSVSMITKVMPNQTDGLMAFPIGNKVMLQFHALSSEEKGMRQL